MSRHRQGPNRARRGPNLSGDRVKLFIPATLIAFTAILPPHVHPYAWGIALAMAALMGALARPRAALWGNGLAPALALAAALVVLNLWASAQPLQSARTLALLSAYALVFVFCASLSLTGERSAIKPAAEFGPIEVALVGAGAGLALHGLYQSLYSFARIAAEQGGSLPEAVRARVETGRAVATLGLPGALGGLLALALPIAIGWSASRRSGAGPRAAGVVCILTMAAGLIATRSAAPVVCLAAAAAAVAWSGGSTRRARRRAIAGGLLALGLIGGSLLLADRLSGSSAGLEGSGPVALRMGNWRVAWQILADYPLVGAGLGCYGIVFPGYRAWGMNESRFAHNSYLQLLAEGGLALGLLVLVMAVALAARRLAPTRGSAAGQRPHGAYHAVACLAFLLHNALDFTLYIPSVAFAFFALAGSAARWRRSDHAPAGVGGRVTLAATALLLAGFAVFTTRGDQAKESARQLLEEGRPAESIAAARAALRANPFDPEAASLLSRLLLERGTAPRDGSMLAEAEGHAGRAVRLDPFTPGHWNHLGHVRLQIGDPLGAYIALHRAAELYPIQISYREERDALARALQPEAKP